VRLREQIAQFSAVNNPSPANWYPDPDAPSRLRFWDGVSWTAHYAPMPAPPTAAPDALASLIGPEWGVGPRAVTNVAVNAPDDGWRRVPPPGAPIDSPINAPTADNRSTPKEALAKLANDKDEGVRLNVAENPSTPKEVLAKLADDEKWYVRIAVASNPSTPAAALAKLAGDKDEYVRMAVANNPSTPKEALAKLANDKSKYVRGAVADNRSTPQEALAKLANDKDEGVRNAARR